MSPPDDALGVSRETTSVPVVDPARDVLRETTEPVAARATADDTPIAAAAEAAVVAAGHRSAAFPRPRSPRRLVVANQKGGVGKTTTTVNVAAAMATRGLRVLVIDLDPQGNATTAFGLPGRPERTVYDVLVRDADLVDAIVEVPGFPNLACVPATIDLAGAEIELVSLVARESRLSRALTGYDGRYDYLFIDCPPSLGLLTLNALVAGGEVFIPIQCEYYALEGLGQLLQNVDLVRSHLNPELRVSTILLTMFDGRTRLAEQVVAEVRQHFGHLTLAAMIPRSVRISEAPGFAQTVITYDPASRGALAYLDAAHEIAERGAGEAVG